MGITGSTRWRWLALAAVVSVGLALLAVGGATATSLFGAPQPYATGAHAHGVSVADLDGDGHGDLVVANAGASTIGVLRGKGDGTFTTAATISLEPGATPKMAAVGDLDGDGRPDIVSADQDKSTVSVILRTSNGDYRYSGSLSMFSSSL